MIPITKARKNTGMSATGGVHRDPLSSTMEHQAPILAVHPGPEFRKPEATQQYNCYYHNSGQHDSHYTPIYYTPITVWHFSKKGEKALFPYDPPKGWPKTKIQGPRFK